MHVSCIMTTYLAARRTCTDKALHISYVRTFHDTSYVRPYVWCTCVFMIHKNTHMTNMCQTCLRKKIVTWQGPTHNASTVAWSSWEFPIVRTLTVSRSCPTINSNRTCVWVRVCVVCRVCFYGVSVGVHSVFASKHIVAFTPPGPPYFIITVSTMVGRFGAGPPRATVIILFSL